MNDNRKDVPPNGKYHWGMAWLRIILALQVYGVHYFAGHSLRHYTWLFSLSVPTFLLMSAYLYGLQRSDKNVNGWMFLKKRFLSIACLTYPLLFVVFLWCIFQCPENINQYFVSLLAEVTFLQTIISEHLPAMGHLWFLQSILICYFALAAATRMSIMRKAFCTPVFVCLIFILLIGCGFIYRGILFPYIFFYLLVYYNAGTIKKYLSKKIWINLALLVVHFYLASLNYSVAFHYGIYLFYIQQLLFSIVLVCVFEYLSEKLPHGPQIVYWSSLTMSFYLVHHIFAFEWPLWSGLLITTLLSILLNEIGMKLKDISILYFVR